jgi:predicted transcriptional regulator with HTH domain
VPGMEPIDFRLATPALPPNVSDVYYDLKRYVDKTFHDQPRHVQSIIFALAYAQYSKEKKVQINDHILRGVTRGDLRVRRCYSLFKNEIIYERYCAMAQQSIQDLFREVEGTLLERLEQRIIKHIDAAERTRVISIEKIGIKRFLLTTGEHVLSIITVVVLVWAAAELIPRLGGFIKMFNDFSHATEILKRLGLWND